MKIIYYLLSLFYILLFQSGCKTQLSNVDSSIKKRIKDHYGLQCDSVLQISKTDYQTYYAFNLVADSINMDWWSFCSYTTDSTIFYNTFYDFVSSIFDAKLNKEKTVAIIKNSMVDHDYQWQCHLIENNSACYYYSRHGLSLVATDRRLKTYHDKIINNDRLYPVFAQELKSEIESWQKYSFGFSFPYIIFLSEEDENSDALFCIIRSEYENKYSYDLLLNTEKTFFFSIEDACSLYYNENSIFSPNEVFVKIIDTIISYGSVDFKYECIKELIQLMEKIKQ